MSLIDNPADYIVLAGKKSPGLADVLGAESLRSYRIFQPPFSTGARIIYMRKELAEFSVKFRLYTEEHHAEWEAWRPLVDAVPDIRREAKGLDIQHPLLAPLGIKSVVVKSVSQLEQTDSGEWTVTIKFLEHKGLPKQTMAKVEGSKATPVDPVDARIEELAKQVQELANE